MASIRGFAQLPQRMDDRRRKAIARQWDRQGFSAPKLRRVLKSFDQWDAGRFAKMTGLTAGEAAAVLINAGYEVGSDGLFRLADSEDAAARRAGLDDIARQAQERGPGRSRDWFDDGEPDDE